MILADILPDMAELSFDIDGADEFNAVHFIHELHEPAAHLAAHARHDRLYHGFPLDNIS